MGKQMRQLQAYAAGGARDQCRLGSQKRITGTHDSVIADFAALQQGLGRFPDSDVAGTAAAACGHKTII